MPPTIADQGYTLHTCTACGDSYKDNYTDVLEYVIGDVNSDGEITARDAAMAYAIVNGKYDPSDSRTLAANVNGDGEITARDAAMIYACVNGKLASFPVG